MIVVHHGLQIFTTATGGQIEASQSRHSSRAQTAIGGGSNMRSSVVKNVLQGSRQGKGRVPLGARVRIA